MEEAIKSGIGGETGDSIIQTINNKPIWLLKPLPLSQVNPYITSQSSSSSSSTSLFRPRIGPPPSLQTSCLETISQCFHMYDAHSLVGLYPDHVRRIISKIRSDRYYVEPDESTMVTRPDEATVWVFNVLSDPEGADEMFTLGMDMGILLRHLPTNPRIDPPDHPLNQIPKLYKTLQPGSPFELLTTIKFDGVRGAASSMLDDGNIMALRYATHLTALWTVGCKVTDAGIRLLAASLKLPGPAKDAEGMGMWRLRAWFLRGCKDVGDRSMRSFARWPGLVVLDLRDTSCTVAARGILNSSSEGFFPSLAHLQPVNPGLRAIFNPKSPPGIVVKQLSQTLLGGTRQSRSLNIVPCHVPLPVECLPEATVRHVRASEGAAQGVFRAGGIGHIYGTHVDAVTDETAIFRETVKTALMKQAVEDGLMEDPWEVQKAERVKAREWDRRHQKKMRDNKAYRKKYLKGYKPDKMGKGADERSKKLAVGMIRMEMGQEGMEVVGEEALMLVRVGQKGWERLEWNIVSAAQRQSELQSQVNGSSSQSSQGMFRTQRKADLVGDILGTLGTTSSPLITKGPLQTPSSPSQPGSSPVQPSRPSNPFRSSTQTSKRQLDSPSSSPSSDPLSFTQRTINSQDSTISPVDPFDVGFGPPKKRRFGGAAAAGEESSRRGLKMFSGPRR